MCLIFLKRQSLFLSSSRGRWRRRDLAGEELAPLSILGGGHGPLSMLGGGGAGVHGIAGVVWRGQGGETALAADRGVAEAGS